MLVATTATICLERERENLRLGAYLHEIKFYANDDKNAKASSRIPMKCLRERIFNFNFVRQMTTTTMTTMHEEFLIICINSPFISVGELAETVRRSE